MNKVDAGHACPVTFARRSGMRLIEGTSPKLQRRVRLYSYANFAIWIGLEASPEVTSFCEYPVRTGPNASDPIVDFWVRTKDRDEYLVSPDHPSGTDWPAQLNGRIWLFLPIPQKSKVSGIFHLMKRELLCARKLNLHISPPALECQYSVHRH